MSIEYKKDGHMLIKKCLFLKHNKINRMRAKSSCNLFLEGSVVYRPLAKATFEPF